MAVLTDTWPVNLIDVGIVVLLVFGIIAGWRSGFFPQILGLAGAALGAIGVVLALPLAHDFLAGVDPALRAIGVLVGLLVAIGVGEAIGSNLGAAIGRRLRQLGVPPWPFGESLEMARAAPLSGG